MDYGAWTSMASTIDHGLWTMVSGPRTMDYGLRTMYHEPWTMDYGPWARAPRVRMTLEPRVQNLLLPTSYPVLTDLMDMRTTGMRWACLWMHGGV